jgi:CubicO group peptidase (beta-lactamase class C family)
MRTYCAFLVAAASVWAQSGLVNQPSVAASIRVYEAWLNGQMAYRGLPGVAVGVVHADQLVWAKGFGYADVAAKTPVTPSTLFRMASHTKMFTAVAILQLRDQ